MWLLVPAVPSPLVLWIHSQLYLQLCITPTGCRIPGESSFCLIPGHIQHPSWQEEGREVQASLFSDLIPVSGQKPAADMEVVQGWLLPFPHRLPAPHRAPVATPGFSRDGIGQEGKIDGVRKAKSYLAWYYQVLVLLLSGC